VTERRGLKAAPILTLLLSAIFSLASCDEPGGSSVITEPTTTVAPTAGDAKSGTRTGIEGVDEVIEAVLIRDESRLAQMFKLQEVGCSNASGLGGPPPCHLAPGGSAPDGTLIAVFPSSNCELGWATDVDASVHSLIGRAPLLYGVVEFQAQPLSESFLPDSTHGIVLEVQQRDGTD
jgi:hypothetical protein